MYARKIFGARDSIVRKDRYSHYINDYYKLMWGMKRRKIDLK